MVRKIGCLTALFSLMAAGCVFGETWENTPLGWVYKTKDGSLHKKTWQWIDGNRDGVAECYYFNEEGYLVLDGVTPDGYSVNGEGAWIENGAVQIKTVALSLSTVSTKDGASENISPQREEDMERNSTLAASSSEGILLLGPDKGPGGISLAKEASSRSGPAADNLKGDSVSSGAPNSRAPAMVNPSLNRSYASARSQAEKTALLKEIEEQLAGLRENPSHEEALRHMVWVEVPVWRLKNGEKVPDTAKVQILNRLAEDVKAIFQEIYEGPEKFPIKYIVGYTWRPNGLQSKHSLGLAIDINPDENPQVDAKGNVLVGKKWEPGVSPYSITEGGDVVRAFRSRNWIWGDRFRRPDYMHFEF